MDDEMYLKAEVVYNQIEKILKGIAEKRNFGLIPWYHDEPRWFLEWRSKRGQVTIEVCYYLKLQLEIMSRVYEDGRWKTLCSPESIDINKNHKERRHYYSRIIVPKRKFRSLLTKIVNETLKQAEPCENK